MLENLEQKLALRTRPRSALLIYLASFLLSTTARKKTWASLPSSGAIVPIYIVLLCPACLDTLVKCVVPLVLMVLVSLSPQPGALRFLWSCPPKGMDSAVLWRTCYKSWYLSSGKGWGFPCPNSHVLLQSTEEYIIFRQYFVGVEGAGNLCLSKEGADCWLGRSQPGCLNVNRALKANDKAHNRKTEVETLYVYTYLIN